MVKLSHAKIHQLIIQIHPEITQKIISEASARVSTKINNQASARVAKKINNEVIDQYLDQHLVQ